MSDARYQKTRTTRFEFGRNWKTFLNQVDVHRRVQSAKEMLTEFYEVETFSGRSFLDVGSGSGLYSLAAYNLGADSIVSFDYDKDAVECTSYLKSTVGNPNYWTVQQGDILNDDFVTALPQADLVYCFGVLHHTGDMWTGLENTLRLMKPGGRLYLALYNNVNIAGISTKDWRRIKEVYNSASAPVRKVMEAGYFIAWTLYVTFVKQKNPVSFFKQFPERRGMSVHTDIKDWLGGLPYETASIAEVRNFLKKRHGRFILEKTIKASAKGNNSYLIAKK